ncbi:hypothetical protein [Maribacter sp. 2308TA10-17]|uniref:hypothetical protein n=1 Tax=Maribacter sp. 2308TA10-17 TaxID=3386276 RepID=UPI0039BD3158
MKTNFFNLLGLFIVMLFMACDKETIDDQVTSADVSEIKLMIIDGEWKVTRYFDDIDETSNYTGFVFDFGQDGVLGASNGNIASSGSWSIDFDSSNDSESDVDFNIFFTNPDVLEELTEDWDIVSYSDTKIELKDVSGGDGSLNFLTLEKI